MGRPGSGRARALAMRRRAVDGPQGRDRALIRTMLDPEKRKNFKMPDRQEVMLKFKALIESGQLKPPIGKTFTLAEVPEAMRCMLEERVIGRIIVTPAR